MTAIDDTPGSETLEVGEPTFDDLAARVDELRDRVRHSEEQALLEETLEAITDFNRAGSSSWCRCSAPIRAARSCCSPRSTGPR